MFSEDRNYYINLFRRCPLTGINPRATAGLSAENARYTFNTAFCGVCADGDLERAKVLFVHVTNINVHNSEALRFAIANEHFDIADFLFENGGLMTQEIIDGMTISEKSMNYWLSKKQS